MFKTPNCLILLRSALIPSNELPMFEDVEITGSDIICIPCSIQGDVGPGDCDAIHWQDSLVRFGVT